MWNKRRDKSNDSRAKKLRVNRPVYWKARICVNPDTFNTLGTRPIEYMYCTGDGIHHDLRVLEAPSTMEACGLFEESQT